jgi:hypothetical protein
MPNVLFRTSADGDRLYESVTLSEIGKNEQYLEDIIAAAPEILRLSTKGRGIYGSCAIFRQVNLTSPTGRVAIPDIVMLCQSGHVIVVEVKLYSNPELKDRRVISQVIDYASILSSMTEEELLLALCPKESGKTTWHSFVEQRFPDEADIDDLASTLIDRIRSARLNMVIACDRCPPGLRDVVSSVIKQEVLDFKFEVVEVTPYVNQQNGDDIIFSSSRVLETEVIARTSVTVTYQQGLPRPGLEVQTTSLDEIEENISLTNAGRTMSERAREWSEDEIDQHFGSHEDPVIRDLYRFCRSHTSNGKISAPGLKINPALGMYVTTEKGTKFLLNYVETNNFVTVYMNMMEEIFPHDGFSEFRKKLMTLFPGSKIDVLKQPPIAIEDLSAKMEEFLGLIESMLPSDEQSE